MKTDRQRTYWNCIIRATPSAGDVIRTPDDLHWPSSMAMSEQSSYWFAALRMSSAIPSNVSSRLDDGQIASISPTKSTTRNILSLYNNMNH